MSKKKKELRLVKVTWLDIVADLHTDNKIEPVESYTAGWIDKQNKDYIRILTGYYKDECDLTDQIVIPMGCVTKIEDLIVDGN